MNELRKAAEMALEGLEGGAFGEERRRRAEALRQALAQPEQEPVAWYGVDADGEKYLGWDKQDLQDEGFAWVVPLYSTPVDTVNISQERVDEIEKRKHEPVAWVYNGILHEFDPSEFATSEVIPLYSTPPKREWVGLTDDEIEKLIRAMMSRDQAFIGFVRSVEAKLKEKNA